jgi:DNA polymerase-3 subunit gamma/tau
LLKLVDALLEQGQDMRQFLSGVVEHLRNLLVVKISPDPAKIVELPAADIEAIKQQAAAAEAEHLLLLFDSLSKTLDDIRWSPHQRFTFEVGLIKACSLAPLKPLAEVLARLKTLEARLASGHGSNAPLISRIHERSAEYSSKAPVSSSPPPPAAASSGGHDDAWSRIMNALKSKKPGLASALAHSKLVEMTDTELVISLKGSGFQKDLVEKRENRSVIEDLAAEILSRKVQIKIQLLAEAATPDTKQKMQKKQKPEEQDPIVQDALRIFGGEVVEPDHPHE